MVTRKDVSRYFIICFCCLALFSCHRHNFLRSNRQLSKWMDRNEVLKNSFTGIYIEDLQTGKKKIDFNGQKYFTPASNTKLLTWYAAQKYLPELLPALWYAERADTLYFMGSGNPSMGYTKDTTIQTFLRNQIGKKLVFTDQNFSDQPLGKGWAWDDVSFDYSTEKSALPIVGNLLRINGDTIFPACCTPWVQRRSGALPRRAWNANEFMVDTNLTAPVHIPLIMSGQLTATILAEVLKCPVHYLPKVSVSEWNTLFAGNRDTMLRAMLQESDNFLAEQMLLMCSGNRDSLQHTLSVDQQIKDLLTKDFAEAPQKPKWVDGSGLSRYNLMTPKFLVYALKKIRKELQASGKSDTHMWGLLPQAGVSGTLKQETNYPQVTFAKTGSLSNNHTISGFLRSASGRTFVFSIMMNHYLAKGDQMRMEIAKILQQLNKM